MVTSMMYSKYMFEKLKRNKGHFTKEACDLRFIIPYLCSRSRKEILSKTTLEYTHDAEKHHRNVAINLGVVELINFRRAGYAGLRNHDAS